jgi:hypothetical protein
VGVADMVASAKVMALAAYDLLTGAEASRA